MFLSEEYLSNQSVKDNYLRLNGKFYIDGQKWIDL